MLADSQIRLGLLTLTSLTMRVKSINVKSNLKISGQQVYTIDKVRKNLNE
jgi:hypothetical protein